MESTSITNALDRSHRKTEVYSHVKISNFLSKEYIYWIFNTFENLKEPKIFFSNVSKETNKKKKIIPILNIRNSQILII